MKVAQLLILVVLTTSGCASEMLVSARKPVRSTDELVRDTGSTPGAGGGKASDAKNSTAESGDPAIALQHAEQLWREGDSAGCERVLKTLLRQNPRERTSRRLLADLYASQNDYERAEQQLARLLAEDPSDAQAHHSLALALEELGRTELAARHYDEACRLEPDNVLYQLSRSVQRNPFANQTGPSNRQQHSGGEKNRRQKNEGQNNGEQKDGAPSGSR